MSAAVASVDATERLCKVLSRHRQSLVSTVPVLEGRLVSQVGLTLVAEGCAAALGERCQIGRGAQSVEAEVIGFDGDRTLLMPLTTAAAGMSRGARVRPLGSALDVPTGDALLGRVIDATGEPVDGRGPLSGCTWASMERAELEPLERAPVNQAFDVGVRSINALLTLGRGQRVGLFAGSGVGKSSLLGMMTKHSSAEITVIALIGERGREVSDFVRETLGPEGLARSVVIAVPADRPPLARLRGAWLATAIAEGFRDAGRDVLLLVDSLTRIAQAQREIGLAGGEPPTVKGYPPSVFSLLPQYVERAGSLSGRGTITGLYTVLAEGDDQNDPVVDAARAVLDGHIVLSRALADAASHPAIDIGASVSRTRTSVTDAATQKRVSRVLKLSAVWRQKEDLVQAGLYERGSDAELDRAMAFQPRLKAFLEQDLAQGVSMDVAMRTLAELADSASSPQESAAESVATGTTASAALAK